MRLRGPQTVPLRHTQVFMDEMLLQGITEAFPCLHLMLAVSVATMQGRDTGFEGAKLGEDSYGRSTTELGRGTSLGGREGERLDRRSGGTTGGAGPATATFWSCGQVEPWMVEVRRWRRKAKGLRAGGEKRKEPRAGFASFLYQGKPHVQLRQKRAGVRRGSKGSLADSVGVHRQCLYAPTSSKRKRFSGKYFDFKTSFAVCC